MIKITIEGNEQEIINLIKGAPNLSNNIFAGVSETISKDEDSDFIKTAEKNRKFYSDVFGKADTFADSKIFNEFFGPKAN